MDLWISAFGFIWFGFFLFALAFVFRVSKEAAALRWMVVIGALFGLLCLGSWWLLWSLGLIGADIPVSQMVIGGVLAAAMYGLWIMVFLFGIFSAGEASITVHILGIIAGAGTNGIGRHDLIAKYNRRNIVERRIQRFLWSGELVRAGRMYRRSGRASYFMLREHAAYVFRLLFPPAGN